MAFKSKTSSPCRGAEPRADEERIRRRQEFVAELKRLRNKAVEEGMPLMTWEEIQQQIAHNRGEA